MKIKGGDVGEGQEKGRGRQEAHVTVAGRQTRATRNSKLRQSARDMPCSLRLPGICNFNPETTVLAHIDCVDKGMGYKSPDFWAVFACSACHAALDQHRIPSECRSDYILGALYETWKRWMKEGLIRAT